MQSHPKSDPPPNPDPPQPLPRPPARLSANPHLQLQRSVYKIDKKTLDIEDMIIDKLAGRHSSCVKGVITNRILRNPLKIPSDCHQDTFVLDLGTRLDITALRFLLSLPNGQCFYSKFETELLFMLKQQGCYFSVFHKFKPRSQVTVLQGLSAFLVFLAKFFKAKFVTTTSQFLLYFLSSIYQSHESEQQVSKCLTGLVRNSNELSESLAAKFAALENCQGEFLGAPSELMELFLEYLMFHRVLPAAEA
jgi:hypothetical protein